MGLAFETFSSKRSCSPLCFLARNRTTCRRALLVGRTNRGASCALRNPVDDISSFARILTKTFGYDAEKDIRVLVDEVENSPAGGRGGLKKENTAKQDVLDAIEWLLKGTKKGDHLIFLYCANGLASSCGTDARGPCGCRVDDGTLGGIAMRELLVSRVPKGVELVVVIDSCNSDAKIKLRYTHGPPSGANGQLADVTASQATLPLKSAQGKTLKKKIVEITTRQTQQGQKPANHFVLCLGEILQRSAFSKPLGLDALYEELCCVLPEDCYMPPHIATLNPDSLNTLCFP